MRLVAAVLTVSLLLSACSSDDGQETNPTATAGTSDATVSAGPTGTPASATPGTIDFEEPPTARLVRPDGRNYAGARGTFCWAGNCFDYIAYASNVDVIPLHPGELLSFDYDRQTPDAEDVRWFPVVEVPDPDESGVLFWQPPFISGDDAFSTGPETPSEHGLYLITVFATWDGEPAGDALYGYYVTVR